MTFPHHNFPCLRKCYVSTAVLCPFFEIWIVSLVSVQLENVINIVHLQAPSCLPLVSTRFDTTSILHQLPLVTCISSEPPYYV